MAKSTIRSLSPFDAPWLAVLHQQAFDPSWSTGSFTDLLNLPTTQGWMIEACAGENPGGVIMLQVIGAEAEVLMIQVAEAAQGNGLGRALLAHAITTLGDLGVQRLYLEVAASRVAAHRLYNSQGFVCCGTRKNYYKTTVGHEDAQCMYLTLKTNHPI